MICGPVGGEHQAEVEEPAIRQAFLAEACDGGFDDVVFDLVEDFLRNESAAGHRAHAAGVRAEVAVERAFVIPRRGEDEVLIVDDRGEHRDFRAGQALLDEHPPRAEAALRENLVEEGQRGRLVRANRHALAGGEAVELEHRRILAGDGGDGFFQGVGGRRPRGRDAVSNEELFRKLLAGFQLRGLLGRAPAWDAVPFAEIRQAFAFDEIAFLTRHAEVDGIGFHPRDQRSPNHRHRTGLASSKIASLPGKQNNSGFPGDSANALTSACSRPPLPTTSILIRGGFRGIPAKTQSRIVLLHVIRGFDAVFLFELTHLLLHFAQGFLEILGHIRVVEHVVEAAA